MIQKRISNLDALSNELAQFDDRFLFRGQNDHYLTADGATSIRSSFWVNGGPLGCVPPLRAAWVNFAHFTLYALTGNYDLPEHLTEAILQHYGWKSFFLDVTRSPAMAAWFACHRFSEQAAICMTENSAESPLWMRGKSARFERSPDGQDGHIYVISAANLAHHDLKLLDLESITTERRRSRPEVQRACLIGPTKTEPLSESLIAAHFTVPNEVLAQLAANEGFETIESVFPKPEDDPIYGELLSGPWEKLQLADNIGIPAYKRLLEIPDYFWGCPRRLTGRETLFDGTSVEQISANGDGPFAGARFVRIDEPVFFFPGHDPETSFYAIRRLIVENELVVFELPRLWGRPDVGADADMANDLRPVWSRI